MSLAPESQVDKKLNLKDDLNVINIDNTAPVNKVLDDIEHSNQKAFMFLKLTRKRRFNKKYLQNRHHALPGHPLTSFPDDWDADLDPDYCEPFPYKCTKPKIITPLKNKDKSDPVSELLKLKHEWFTKYFCQKKSATGYKVALIDKLKELNDEVVSCPKHLVDMAEHASLDPDPYFNSPSNWYYAGNGNMQILCYNYTEYVLCSHFNFCYLFEFSNDDLPFNSNPAAVFDCGEGNNIYESICSTQDIIALRTKHKIFVLKIKSSEDTIIIEQLKVSESELPFTSISFDEYHKNVLYVTDLNNVLKIVNLDRMTAKTVLLKNKVRSLVNNWSTVIGSERPYYTHVTKNSISTYDKRTNSIIHKWKSPNDVSDEALCNFIGVAKFSPGSPHLYFGTSHHLFLMDLRYQKTDFKLLQRWTHGMQCSPTYMSLCNFEFNKELVCLSSQWCEDLCFVPNYIQSLKGSELRGVTMPYRPKSILKTLNEARLQGLCHDIYRSVEDRLVTSLTGTLLLERAEKYVILSQNGLGDIMSHILYPEHLDTFVEDDSTEALHLWSQEYDVEKKDFEVSFVRDISKIWKKLRKVPEGYINERLDEESKFNEQEIYDIFENEELDAGLLDVWVEQQDTTQDQTLGLSLDISQNQSLGLSLDISQE